MKFYVTAKKPCMVYYLYEVEATSESEALHDLQKEVDQMPVEYEVMNSAGSTIHVEELYPHDNWEIESISEEEYPVEINIEYV